MHIRDAAAADEAAWRGLWADYCGHFGKTLPEAVTAATWHRILDPAAPIFARLAIVADRPVGFAVSVLHAGTWVSEPICYLEDLFVDQPVRGRGVGAALVADIIARAEERGWARVYWHTATANPARALYDRFVAVGDVVRYQLHLERD